MHKRDLFVAYKPENFLQKSLRVLRVFFLWEKEHVPHSSDTMERSMRFVAVVCVAVCGWLLVHLYTTAFTKSPSHAAHALSSSPAGGKR